MSQILSTGNGLACSCAEHVTKGSDCVHILRELERLKGRGLGFRIMERSNFMLCKHCDSGNIIKKQIRRNKSGDVQTYQCKDCGKRFSLNLGFERMRYEDGVITRALGMYFAKMSTRRIADQFESEGVDVSYQSIHNWVVKYSKSISVYVNGIVPRVGNWFRGDEVWVKVRGQKYYLFATMDDDTRYWLASELADSKDKHNAEDIFRMTKQMAGKGPRVLITDGLPAYQKAARKVFGNKTYHKCDAGIRSKRIGSSGNYHPSNNKMERLNGEIRDREKVFRGLKKDDSAILDGFRVYYNFAKKHGSLKGRTPAEVAGIRVDGANKWKTLIQNASLDRLRN
ncbi:MAG: DDE-type integrase/transposase/recombinase [Thaumarchaeota archaeon]|nr:DDE-type integrase/transposase/recombinase [Nitrososphaerota archaeon]MDE0339079.1 DDE-type integrase/transposase/recombinase [Caldilineaceae bacterium]